MSAYAGPEIVEDGLVLYLDAANERSYPGSGTTWYDLSVINNNGTIYNGTEYTSNDNGTWLFDGVNDYISIAEPAIPLSPNKFTLCVWVKPENQYSRFITPFSNGIDQFIAYNNTAQTIDVTVTERSDVNNRRRAGTNYSVPVGIWSFFCLSIDNLSIKMYVNGSLTREYTETIDIAGWSSGWRIGQRGNGTGWFLGEISLFSIYSRILNDIEVFKFFNATRSRFGI